ncbi:unnamed protein product [Caenorhabditis angaria]|uniref:Uncharacterized protein n=1 Tax=Caenorhabditis angaria TaxID=860376 RepID=A0A9P1IB60_9PELO|nr:unnamed protein product [Caenorhabditis angaria]
MRFLVSFLIYGYVLAKFTPSQEQKKFAEKIGNMLLSQSSVENPNSIHIGLQLGKHLNFSENAKICDELDMNEAGFLEYLAHDRKIFKKINKTSDIVNIKYATREIFEIQFNLTNKMNYIETKTFEIFAAGNSIYKIQMGGACSDANRINPANIYRRGGNVEKLDGKGFIEIVKNMLPFNETSIRFSKQLLAFIETNPNVEESYNLTEFLNYMKIFNDRYEHLKNAKQTADFKKAEEIVILEENDMINKDKDKMWKIYKIIVRPISKIHSNHSIFRPIQVLMKKIHREIGKLENEKVAKFSKEMTKKLEKVEFCGVELDVTPGNFSVDLNGFKDFTIVSFFYNSNMLMLL